MIIAELKFCVIVRTKNAWGTASAMTKAKPFFVLIASENLQTTDAKKMIRASFATSAG